MEEKECKFSFADKLMVKAKILVVEDEEDIVELVNYNLTKEGYRAECVTSGEDALRKVKESVYDLMVLDLMLPGVDGLEVCKILKNDSQTAHIPIIMLTAKSEESDIVLGLEFGADDAFILTPNADGENVTLRHLKSRNGETRDIELRFDRPRQRFTPVTVEPVQDAGGLRSKVAALWNRTKPAPDDEGDG